MKLPCVKSEVVPLKSEKMKEEEIDGVANFNVPTPIGVGNKQGALLSVKRLHNHHRYRHLVSFESKFIYRRIKRVRKWLYFCTKKKKT